MSNRIYTVEAVGDDVADFLDAVLDSVDFDLEYEILAIGTYTRAVSSSNRV